MCIFLNRERTMAKPFIKWVGGKGQLLAQLEALLPADFGQWQDVTYVEPFVGGGAMLFHMLQSHQNITRAVINDINSDLTTCYRVVRDEVEALIALLQHYEEEYYQLEAEAQRREYFLGKRASFNTKALDDVENTAHFILLNRTCFNGLYRVNAKGQYNVPFGKYEHPKICDSETLRADSELLGHVEILTGDYTETLQWAQHPSLFYFDPPYRPLSETSSFNNYTADAFDDVAQVRLKEFCDAVSAAGHRFMLSNSDPMGKNGDPFFDNLYQHYSIERVWASRNVNATPTKRGKLTEILVHN